MVRLYGITSVQTYIYFNNSPRDGMYFKSTVRTYYTFFCYYYIITDLLDLDIYPVVCIRATTRTCPPYQHFPADTSLRIIDTLGALFSFYGVYQYCVKALLKPTIWTQVPWFVPHCLLCQSYLTRDM